MSARRRRKTREQDLTGRYLAGEMDQDDDDPAQRFSDRSKNAEQEKILRTVAMRAAAEGADGAMASLRIGQVIQVYSLFCEVLHEGQVYLCVTRKTVNRSGVTGIVVGDQVRFLPSGTRDELGRPEAVIEQALPRKTILTRTGSFNARQQQPIVANAQQMLIVASLLRPRVKWGLVDRMIIAAQSGGLRPIVCLNKIDLAASPGGESALSEADAVLQHYQSLDVATLRTSAEAQVGLDELRLALKDQSTVLAGHSGVGKSTLINAVQPSLDLRTGIVSEATDKGRHTTTSARCFFLDFGGAVIDTPGVKLFGLWGITRKNLPDFFPDIAAGSAPSWRIESFERISQSLPEGGAR